ncbi:MAG: glycosyl hydrolase 2 galactose-binding domain-containing protein [bacterium]
MLLLRKPLFFSFIVASVLAFAQAFVWLEGERPSEANQQFEVVKVSDVLSEGKWLVKTLSKEDVSAGKLGNGLRLVYRFTVNEAGNYYLWIRLGYEFVRAPLIWQIDEGEKREISPDELTTNLTELGVWYEVAWLKAGEVYLATGNHTLTLVANKPGPDGRFLLAIDAIAFVKGEWVPDGCLKPGEEPASDLDVKASENIFRFPVEVLDNIRQNKRGELPLNGLWQVCRDDDLDMDRETYEPVKEVPSHPHWRGINVPSNLHSLPDMNMAHRVWYRCRVEIPKELLGKSFILDFSGTNWIASVVVNGVFVGWHKSTRVPWKIDITKAIKAGVNEILIGIKDPWYAIDGRFHRTSLNRMRNIPTQNFGSIRFVAPIYPSTKGDANGTEAGITDPVSLIVAGQIYVEDVFIKTSVRDGKLTLDLTLRNNSEVVQRAFLDTEAVFSQSNEVEKRFPQKEVEIPPNSSHQLEISYDWKDAKLWWPGDDPANLYRLRTRLVSQGKIIDELETPFGFREITIEGIYIKVNGVRYNFWNLLDGLKGQNPEELLEHFKKGNNRFERFSEDLRLRRFFGPRRHQLDWTDAHGIPGRLSTMIDGMFINYDLSNPLVWENFREHIRQVVLAYRNHPSVFFYSLENEIGFINGRLAYRHIMDKVENEHKGLIDEARKLDPTRPSFLDGSGALRDQYADINCLHYPEAQWDAYPEGAYRLQFDSYVDEMGWNWDRKRPLAMGEMTFFSGKNADHAWIGGDSVFEGRYYAKRAYAKFVNLLLEAYRWNDVAILCPWIGMDDFPECWKTLSPLAVFVREQNWRFFSQDKVERTIKVFNDTLSDKPVKLSWQVVVNERRIAGDELNLKIEPGFGKEMRISFILPKVTRRTSGKLILEVSQEGGKPFEDVKDFWIFPKVKSLKLKYPVYVLRANEKILRFLKEVGIIPKQINSLDEVTIFPSILLIPPNAISLNEANSDFLSNFLRKGGRVICLEQDNPIKLVGSINLNPTSHQASYNFPLGGYSPIFNGLKEGDFSNWAGASPTAEKVWEKPAGKIRSLVVCGPGLSYTSLLEIPLEKGLLLASQLKIGEKIKSEPSAQFLLLNLLSYADAYQPVERRIFVLASTAISDFLKSCGYDFVPLESLADAFAQSLSILIIEANKENLRELLNYKNKVEDFVAKGGWIMLWGLTPEGLEDFNKLLGTKHLIREFRLERVSLIRDPLDEGLGNCDVLQYSDEEIMFGDKWLSQNVFTYCVDGEDIAPFCKLPNQPEGPYRPTKDDHDPFNMVNGMTGHDFWRYIYQIWYGDWSPTGSPPFLFKLPIPCKIKGIEIWNNAYYDTIKDLEIQIDGKKATSVELPDAMVPTTIGLKGEEAKESVGLVVRSVRKHQNIPLVGIDNIRIFRELPDWYKGRVFPLVNVGGLVRYPRGKGGFILNQLNIKSMDTRENMEKKRRILSTILLNLSL